ncbi:MAG: hypothetical protein ABIK28_10655 [Planctomycetota bacterium]
MNNRYLSSLLVVLLCITLAGCQASKNKGDPSRPGSATYVDLSALGFEVESVSGHVQIKADRTAEWKDLKVGESFNGFAFIRSGLQSKAILVMKQGHRRIRCELNDLICQTSINELYDKVLSPEAVAEYKEKMWDKGFRVDPEELVHITRESLERFKEKTNLLANANSAVLTKQDQSQTAGASAAPGTAAGGGGGGGGSGGGCSGGG